MMEIMEVENIYHIVSIIVMPISMIVAVAALVCSQKTLSRELKEANNRMIIQLQHNYEIFVKQTQETFFAEYTKRYQDIILHMPDDEKNSQWIKYVRLYFDLCSEEYHLHEKGLINDDVWKLWVDGMRDDVKRQSFRNAWIHPLGQCYNDNGFINFMNQEIINYGTKQT